MFETGKHAEGDKRCTCKFSRLKTNHASPSPPISEWVICTYLAHQHRSKSRSLSLAPERTGTIERLYDPRLTYGVSRP